MTEHAPYSTADMAEHVQLTERQLYSRLRTWPVRTTDDYHPGSGHVMRWTAADLATVDAFTRLTKAFRQAPTTIFPQIAELIHLDNPQPPGETLYHLTLDDGTAVTFTASWPTTK